MRTKNNRKGHRGPYRPDHIVVLHPEEQTLLLPFLLAKLAPLSRTTVKSLLAHSHVSHNGNPTTQFDEILEPGDEVVINHTRPFRTLRTRMCRLVWEDQDLIVVEKASGLLTVAAGRQREKTAQQIVDDYLFASDGRSHAYVCHRLDQFTSGLIIFAKNSHVQQMLRDSWATYVVERLYMAVVEGRPEQPEGEIRSYLAENSAMKVYSTQDPEKGKLSVTRYKVLAERDGYSQVDIQLLTGRKNQIRVHMSDLGCPVTGDRKYGARYNPWGRMMLHNYVLQFVHPITRENLRFTLPIPKHFNLSGGTPAE